MTDQAPKTPPISPWVRAALEKRLPPRVDYSTLGRAAIASKLAR